MAESGELKSLEDTEFLKKVSIFDKLTPEEMERIGGIIRKRNFAKGDTIIEEGSSGKALYIVRTGYVKVVKKDDRGEESFLTVLSPGEHFGEVSLVDSHPRSASIIAQQDCEMLEIQGEDFERIIEGDQNLAIKIYKRFIRELCLRLRETDEVMTFGKFY